VIAYRQIADSFIPARHQPALVLDYARSRELDERGDLVLRGTGLRNWEMPNALTALSPTQYLQLLSNVMRTLDSPDTSFMLGQQMLPGHYGALSHALLQAQNLRQALEILAVGHAQLCPLLTPRVREEGGMAVLYWTDSFGAPSQLPALVEMHMTAVTAMCRWLSGEKLPWRYCLNRSAPAHVEQHQVHLGSDLRFNCHLDAMLISPAWLDRPWPRGNGMVASVAAAEAGVEALTPSLLTALYDYLLANIRLGPTLEHSAADFGISPATLKRHLARHGSHFQAELDQVRAHVAIQLFQMRGYDNEAVAQYLGFHDATNFRRSFKRWTGLTPSLLRDGLLSIPQLA
jgi:AraC-like DNA-binding protein